MREGFFGAVVMLFGLAGMLPGQVNVPSPGPNSQPAATPSPYSTSPVYGSQPGAFLPEPLDGSLPPNAPMDPAISAPGWISVGHGLYCLEPAPGDHDPANDPLPGTAAPQVWVNADYLLWWVRPGPLPIPLVTTGIPGTNLSGVIGQPDTRVLFGNTSLDYGAVSGMRYTLGGWFNCDRTLGVEASGFLMQSRSTGTTLASDSTGNPPLYIPAFDAVLKTEGALTVSDPLTQFTGAVTISSRSQLWGADINGLLNLCRSDIWEVNALVGFRYLNLTENLTLDNTTTDSLNTVDILHDGFATRNQFYGGQLGTRVGCWLGPWSAVLTTKVALGDTREIVNVSGSISQSGPFASSPGTFPGGFFTQPSNMGSQARSQFSVVPEAELKLGCQLWPWMRVSVGYNFLYWTNVVRPGDQIDRSLNLTQSPIFGTGQQTLPASPQPQFNTTEFWAHGVTFGLQLQY